MDIVYWENYLQWNHGAWECSNLKKVAEGPYQMKLNAYRVLLTRGRVGTIICLNKNFMGLNNLINSDKLVAKLIILPPNLNCLGHELKKHMLLKSKF